MRFSTRDKLDPVCRRLSIRQNLGNHMTTGSPVASLSKGRGGVEQKHVKVLRVKRAAVPDAPI